MKKKLLILSDIKGLYDAKWMNSYQVFLSDIFEVSIIDIHTLAGIDGKELTNEDLHVEFINGGIDHAVNQLISQKTEATVLVGFSIGGLIAWRSCLEGLQVESLILISSTRVRYETQKPDCKLFLIYGENDKFKPYHEWFADHELNYMMINNQGHEFYRKKEFIHLVVEKIKENI